MTAVVMKKMKLTPLILAREYPLHLPSAQGTTKYLNNAIHNLSSLAVLNEMKGWKPLNFVFVFFLSLSPFWWSHKNSSEECAVQKYPRLQWFPACKLCSKCHCLVHKSVPSKKIKIPLNFICIFLSFHWALLFVVTSFCESVNYYYDRTCKWLLMKRFAAPGVIKRKLKGYLTFRFPLYK